MAHCQPEEMDGVSIYSRAAIGIFGTVIDMKPTILACTTVYSGYLTVDALQVRLSDGSIVSREVERHGDAAAVLPYDRERCCALVVRLFRAPVFQEAGLEAIEEACAGMISEAGQDAEATARREAYEELGVRLASMDLVSRVWSSPGVSSERVSLFLAPYVAADRIGAGGGVRGEHEGITVAERSLAVLAAAADQGRIEDRKLLSLVLALRLRHPELFAP
jgi:nudix-type nucleoside diphosphatase (YffH/AdpP family)